MGHGHHHGHPPHVITETLPFERYRIESHWQSRIDEHYTHVDVVGIRCPHCCEAEIPLVAGEIYYACPDCGLDITVEGEALICKLAVHDHGGHGDP